MPKLDKIKWLDESGQPGNKKDNIILPNKKLEKAAGEDFNQIRDKINAVIDVINNKDFNYVYNVDWTDAASFQQLLTKNIGKIIILSYPSKNIFLQGMVNVDKTLNGIVYKFNSLSKVDNYFGENITAGYQNIDTSTLLKQSNILKQDLSNLKIKTVDGKNPEIGMAPIWDGTGWFANNPDSNGNQFLLFPKGTIISVSENFNTNNLTPKQKAEWNKDWEKYNPTKGFSLVASDNDSNIGSTTTGEVKSHNHIYTVPHDYYRELNKGSASGDALVPYNQNTYTSNTTNTGGVNNLAAGIKVQYWKAKRNIYTKSGSDATVNSKNISKVLKQGKGIKLTRDDVKNEVLIEATIIQSIPTINWDDDLQGKTESEVRTILDPYKGKIIEIIQNSLLTNKQFFLGNDYFVKLGGNEYIQITSIDSGIVSGNVGQEITFNSYRVKISDGWVLPKISSVSILKKDLSNKSKILGRDTNGNLTWINNADSKADKKKVVLSIKRDTSDNIIVDTEINLGNLDQSKENKLITFKILKNFFKLFYPGYDESTIKKQSGYTQFEIDNKTNNLLNKDFSNGTTTAGDNNKFLMSNGTGVQWKAISSGGKDYTGVDNEITVNSTNNKIGIDPAFKAKVSNKYDRPNFDKVALGRYAGLTNQGSNTTAIGYRAGENNQSDYSTAIGYKAGNKNQHTQTILINADYQELESTQSEEIKLIAGSTKLEVDSSGLKVNGTPISGSSKPPLIDSNTFTGKTLAEVKTILENSGKVYDIKVDNNVENTRHGCLFDGEYRYSQNIFLFSNFNVITESTTGYFDEIEKIGMTFSVNSTTNKITSTGFSVAKLLNLTQANFLVGGYGLTNLGNNTNTSFNFGKTLSYIRVYETPTKTKKITLPYLNTTSINSYDLDFPNVGDKNIVYGIDNDNRKEFGFYEIERIADSNSKTYYKTTYKGQVPPSKNYNPGDGININNTTNTISIDNNYNKFTNYFKKTDILNNFGTNKVLDNIKDGKITVGKGLIGSQTLKNGTIAYISGIAGNMVGTDVYIDGSVDIFLSGNYAQTYRGVLKFENNSGWEFKAITNKTKLITTKKYVDDELVKKGDKTDVDKNKTDITSLTTEVNTNKTEIAKRAKTSDVNTELAKKADKTTISTLAKKDLTNVNVGSSNQNKMLKVKSDGTIDYVVPPKSSYITTVTSTAGNEWRIGDATKRNNYYIRSGIIDLSPDLTDNTGLSINFEKKLGVDKSIQINMILQNDNIKISSSAANPMKLSYSLNLNETEIDALMGDAFITKELDTVFKARGTWESGIIAYKLMISFIVSKGALGTIVVKPTRIATAGRGPTQYSGDLGWFDTWNSGNQQKYHEWKVVSWKARYKEGIS